MTTRPSKTRSSWNKANTVEDAYIDGGIHPMRICEYAGGFIRLTTEEE